MLNRRRRACVIFAIVLLLAGCTRDGTPDPDSPLETATDEPSPAPAPSSPKTLDVCIVGEPDTLYVYGGSTLPATRHVMEALYDGPVNLLSYAYQPVILAKAPNAGDGDATTLAVRVREGDAVVDATGQVVELEEGVRVHPAGCRSEECAVEFEGGPVLMDRLSVTFVLRDDVTWSDGEPLTVDDWLFAFEIASELAPPAWSELAERTASYRAQGEWRLRWTGLPGYLPPTYPLHFFPPLPLHQLGEYSARELLQIDQTRRSPLGWGPFIVEEWIAGETISLVRSPHYYRASEGLPRLDRVVFHFASGVPEVTARFLAGECDVGLGGDDGAFEPLMPLLLQAEERGLLEVASAPGTVRQQLDLGIAPAAGYERPDLLGDARVRQAIGLCTDRQAIVDEITYGRGAVLGSYVPAEHPLSVADRLEGWAYNPAAGEALLEAAGWLDADEDGIREASRVESVLTGTRFELVLLLPLGDETLERIGRIVKANLADCGIRISLEALPAEELFAAGPEGPIQGRRFDLALTSHRMGFLPACEQYVSSAIPTAGQWDGENISGHTNDEYDDACRRAGETLPGTPAYGEYHREAQAIFATELYALPLFAWPRVALVREGVSNLVVDPTAPSELWNIEMIDLD